MGIAAVVLTEFVDLAANKRRYEGECFEVPWERAEPLQKAGLIMTRERFEHPWGDAPGRQLTPGTLPTQYHSAVPAEGERWLQTLQLTYYDPGSSVYRYHSSVNTVPGVISAFARWLHSNPHCDLRQLDGETQPRQVEHAFKTADVVHVHMDYRPLYHALGRLPDRKQVLVRHYHGSILPGDPLGKTLVENDVDDQHEAVQVGARLYHQRYSDRMHWLPIPVPARDYAALGAALRTPRAGRPWRVAHSPTVRALKGTDLFLEAVKTLQERGYDVEAVLIEKQSHGDALRLKATCDVTFDSFWLGIQGSGLEAAAMGQAVVAGDPAVREEYRRAIGECPYMFAGSQEELVEVLAKLMDDPVAYAVESSRVGRYVRQHHDYPVVGQRYLEILQPVVEACRVAA